MDEVLPGIWHWTVRHPRIGIDVSCHWLDEGGVAIDPLLPPDGLDFFRSRPQAPAAVLLSNRHHYRHAGALADAFGARILCSRPGMHEFEAEQGVEPFDFGDDLPGGVTAFEIGGICPDETALHIRAARALLLADGIVDGGAHGADPGLGFVPDKLMDDPPQTKAALLASARRALDELEFDHLLMAHGPPLIGDGRAQLQELVDIGGRTAFEM